MYIVNCKVCRSNMYCEEEFIEKNARYNNGKISLLCKNCRTQIYKSVLYQKELLEMIAIRCKDEEYVELFRLFSKRNIMILTCDKEMVNNRTVKKIIGFDVGICKFAEIYIPETVNYGFSNLENTIVSIKTEFIGIENDVLKLQLVDDEYTKIGVETVGVMRKVFKYKFGYDIFSSFKEINDILLTSSITYRFVRFTGCYIKKYQNKYQLKMDKKFVDILDPRFNSKKCQGKYFEGIALLKITSNHKIEAIVLYGKIRNDGEKPGINNVSGYNNKKRIPMVDDHSYYDAMHDFENMECFDMADLEIEDLDRSIDYDYNYEMDCEYDGDEFENEEYYDEEEENPYSTHNDVF